MKKIGATCNYICARNKELTDKARKMAVSRGVSLKEVIEEVAESESSRFWVDEDRALRLVQEHRRGIRQRRPERERMVGEISRRTEAMLTERPGLSLSEAVFRVVNSPAPSYYVGSRSVRRALAARKRGFVPEYRKEVKNETND